jgi:hypothetical protein
MPNLIVSSPTQNQVVISLVSVVGTAWETNPENALDSVTVSVDGNPPVDVDYLRPIPRTRLVRYSFGKSNVAVPIDNVAHNINVTASGDTGDRTVDVWVFTEVPQVTIGFDVAPNGIPLADGTDLSVTYSSRLRSERN